MGKIELPTDAKGWVKYVGEIDYRNHRKALLALGVVAAFGVGAGVVMHTRNKHIKVVHGSRQLEDDGIISVVELGEHGKLAAGLPTTEAATDEDGMFVMDETGIAHPSREPLDEGKVNTLRTIASSMLEHFRSRDVTE
jgi:hypothetical protein